MNTIQKYLESPEVKGLAKATRELYRHALNHCKTFIEINRTQSVPITTENPLLVLSEEFKAFSHYLEQQKLSEKSIQQYLTCTKIFLKWAGHPVDFTYKISNKARQENKKKHLDRWFTEDEIEKCLEYRFANVNGDSLKYKVIVRLLIETGARVGEISDIQPEDIHLKEKHVFIQGKTEPRPVFFSEKTRELLKQISGRLSDTLFNHHNRLFPDVSRIKATITQMLKDLGLKNGKDGRGPHTFRHYTATYLFYEGNMRIEDLAFLLGDKVETIRERYLHPTPQMLRKRVAAAMGWD